MTLDLSKFEIDKDIQEQIQSQVSNLISTAKQDLQSEFEQSTSGLKSKNEELLGKLKLAKDKTSDLDVDAINSLLKQMSDDKEATLIKNGQFEEVVRMRVEAALNEQGDQIKTSQERAKEFEQKYSDLLSTNNRMQVENQLTLSAGKVEDLLPTALPDILARANHVWQVKDGKLTAYEGDKQLFDKESNPLSEAQWIEQLRESAPHYFSKATGTGAKGSNGGSVTKSGDVGGDSKARTSYFADKFDLPATN